MQHQSCNLHYDIYIKLLPHGSGHKLMRSLLAQLLTIENGTASSWFSTFLIQWNTIWYCTCTISWDREVLQIQSTNFPIIAINLGGFSYTLRTTDHNLFNTASQMTCFKLLTAQWPVHFAILQAYYTIFYKLLTNILENRCIKNKVFFEN